LEGEISYGVETSVRDENGQNGRDVALGMELDDRECTVGEAEQEHGYAKMPAVVEQREKSGIKAAERADAKNDVQQQECGGTDSADEDGFGGGVRVQYGREDDKDREVEYDAGNKAEVVLLLLGVPTDGTIAGAHGAPPTSAFGADMTPGDSGAGRRAMRATAISTGRTIAKI